MIDSPRVYIHVQSIYVESQLIPEKNCYVFTYTVSLRDFGRFNVQLPSRDLLITNRTGLKIEVQGIGVIGEKLLLQPGSEFQYTNSTILETPLGTMESHCEMVDYQSQSFLCAIPVFRLAMPTLID